VAAVTGTVKRKYTSTLRAEQAGATRRRIRDAAAELFVERGYGRTLIRDIAEAAAVAPRTVHLAYPGGKLQIFQDALNVTVAGDEQPLSQGERMRDSGVLDRPADLVNVLVHQSATLLERAGPLIMATVTSAGADPDMQRLAAEGAAATRANMHTVARTLADHALLRPGIDADHAADVLFALCSPHVHALLRTQRGWDATTYRTWLEETVHRTLIKP
jgi:AcrR family transcriptional regulator